jgi:hypothetical protein
MITRIPAALLPSLTGCPVLIGEKGRPLINTPGLDYPAPAVLLWQRGGRFVVAIADVGEFDAQPESIRVDTLRPAARDMISRAIADRLRVPGDGPAAVARHYLEGWRIERFSHLFDPVSAPLPIPADTPGAEVIERAMAVLWGGE